ncbi:MAG: DUF2442 domain-containing protein [Bacteroidales bacterium]|nr:DUF2442 domain-containing protein [Bacteroidales bacterium]
MEEKIIKVWFEKGQIWIMTTEDKALSLPLELFPILKEASDVQRESYVINKWGDALRWKELDVDIHISSFYEEVEIKKENEVAALFEKFPQLNVSEVARSIGIHKSLLSQYIYGVKTPSEKRVREIKMALHKLGAELMAATAC